MPMKTLFNLKAQDVNACTLIAVNMLNTLLTLEKLEENKDVLGLQLNAIIKDSEKKYNEELDKAKKTKNAAAGQGLSVEQSLKLIQKKNIAKKDAVITIQRSAENNITEEDINTYIDLIKDNYQPEPGLGTAIGLAQALIDADHVLLILGTGIFLTDIKNIENYGKELKKALCGKKANHAVSGKTEDIQVEFESKILNPMRAAKNATGFTILSDGHTISFGKTHDHTCFYYDSQTGNLEVGNFGDLKSRLNERFLARKALKEFQLQKFECTVPVKKVETKPAEEKKSSVSPGSPSLHSHPSPFFKPKGINKTNESILIEKDFLDSHISIWMQKVIEKGENALIVINFLAQLRDLAFPMNTTGSGKITSGHINRAISMLDEDRTLEDLSHALDMLGEKNWNKVLGDKLGPLVYKTFSTVESVPSLNSPTMRNVDVLDKSADEHELEEIKLDRNEEKERLISAEQEDAENENQPPKGKGPCCNII